MVTPHDILETLNWNFFWKSHKFFKTTWNQTESKKYISKILAHVLKIFFFFLDQGDCCLSLTLTRVPSDISPLPNKSWNHSIPWWTGRDTLKLLKTAKSITYTVSNHLKTLDIWFYLRVTNLRRKRKKSLISRRHLITWNNMHNYILNHCIQPYQIQ